MISVILPYWKRAEVTHRSLSLYDRNYRGKLDFEVLLVDDGSHDIEADYPWLRIIRLPKKDRALSPCVPLNRGVSEARGEIISLACPEVMHNTPVLFEMLAELHKTGENGYVIAAAWCEEEKLWHCHTSLTANGYHGNQKQPKGSGFNFCVLMNKSLWDKTGGFDENYRELFCYDDTDFVNRVEKAGGIFRLRDDLVVQHVRANAKSDMNLPSGRGYFDSRWTQ